MNTMKTKIEIENEFTKKFTENDEDGLHFYECGDVAGVLSHISSIRKNDIESVVKEILEIIREDRQEWVTYTDETMKKGAIPALDTVTKRIWHILSEELKNLD